MLCAGVCFCAGAQGEPSCDFDRAAAFALSPEAFNNDRELGWRALADREGCEAEAAELLKAYRIQQIDRQRASIMHHEAQLRAATGQNEAAIALLRDLLDIVDDEATELYHKAEIAFLSRDRDALLAARDDLLALPKPEGFDTAVEAFKQKYPDYPPPVWPTNLKVVEGFIACFDKPYSEAYSSVCQPSGPE